MSQQTPALLRIAFAIDNDDIFVLRLKAACALSGVEYTRELAFKIALHVVDQITSTDGLDVNTRGVDDIRILEAIQNAHNEADTEDVLHALAPETAGTLEATTKEA